MAHDPLTRLLQKVFASCAQQEVNVGTNQRSNTGAQQDTSTGRRRFLKNSACAAAGLLVPPIIRRPGIRMAAAVPPIGDKVVIIGAGMAGLSTAWHLRKHGITSTIYEASGRVGGRMYTMKDQFGPGITTDIGGEFVDSTHADILELVKQLDLELYDLRTDKLIPKTFWFEGRLRGEKDLREALQPFIGPLMKDIHSLPQILSYRTADAFRQLDQQSILGYLRSLGISGWLYAFLEVVLTREYGMEASMQSAINFLVMFEPPDSAIADYELFGPDHEVYKIKGGSQHLTDTLYDRLRDQVVLAQRLVAIHPNVTQGYDLHFESKIVRADHVVLAIPFTILRSVDLTVPMPPEKRKCIEEIGYGNSCKFILGVKEKAWRQAGYQGYTFTDLSFGCGWDSSQSQSEQAGSFTVFGGGDFAESVKNAKDTDLSGSFVQALDTIFPGVAKAYTGKNLKFCWAGYPYNKAAYSSFKVGQWSTLAGWEGQPVGNIYFAGEHVSRDFQGYMNGAAQTGRIAAEAVAAALNQSAAALSQSATSLAKSNMKPDRS